MRHKTMQRVDSWSSLIHQENRSARKRHNKNKSDLDSEIQKIKNLTGKWNIIYRTTTQQSRHIFKSLYAREEKEQLEHAVVTILIHEAKNIIREMDQLKLSDFIAIDLKEQRTEQLYQNIELFNEMKGCYLASMLQPPTNIPPEAILRLKLFLP